MSLNQNYNLRIDTSSQSYEVGLNLQENSSSGSLVTIGGIGYSIIGEEEKVSWVKSKIQNLEVKEFGTFEEFKASLLSSRESTEKVQDVAFNALPKSIQSKPTSEDVREVSVSSELISGMLGKKIDKYLSDLERKVHFSGSVAVKSGGKTLLCKGYGKSSGTTPNKSNTAFQIASVSKQFTAAAILKLVERGDVKLDGKISQYLEPRFQPPSSWENITVRQLLTHTSGLKNNFDCEKFREAKENARLESKPFEPSVEDLIKYFKDEPLREEGEEKPYYSNNGYYLLGAIIENISKKTYGDFIQQEVLPSDMSSTGYYNDNRKSTLPSAVGQHLNEKFDGLTPETDTVAAEAYAAGGLYTTAHDMLTWTDALFSGKVIDEELLGKMSSVQEGEYGFGFEIHDLLGEEVIMSGGILPGGGFKAEMCHFKESGDTIVLLLNNFDLPLEKIRDGILDITRGKEPSKVLGREESQPYFPHGMTFNTEKSDAAHQFEKIDNQYFVVYPNGQKDLLAPLDNNRFINLKWGTEWNFTEHKASCYDRSGSLVGSLLEKSILEKIAKSKSHIEHLKGQIPKKVGEKRSRSRKQSLEQQISLAEVRIEELRKK